MCSDTAYITELIESFGDWDANGDGVLGFDEFLRLWEHLGGDERARATGLLPGHTCARAHTHTHSLSLSLSLSRARARLALSLSSPYLSFSGDPVAEEFQKYASTDPNERPYLDKVAVERMMIEHGFAPTEEYLAAVWEEVSSQWPAACVPHACCTDYGHHVAVFSVSAAVPLSLSRARALPRSLSCRWPRLTRIAMERSR